MSKKPAQPALDPQRLYLISPALADAESFAPALEAALAAGDVACVLLRFAGPDEGTAKKIVRALLPIAQGHEAALLVEGDPKVAVFKNTMNSTTRSGRLAKASKDLF